MRVLVVNAGSSSLKLSLLDERDESLAASELPAPGARVADEAVREALRQDGLGEPDAVAHRIVHGGERFRAAALVDPAVRRELGELADLAPMHQPKSLAALDAVTAELPGVPAVACFDTAFHATLPPEARTYALPRAWRERLGVRRYGFHGLSHAWVARRAPQLAGEAGARRIVSCHLGAGASLCAIAGGRSRETTMGFTPLEGLVMATRSGSVDPGLLIWLLEHEQLSPRELGEALEHESGLLGLSGSARMEEVVQRAAEGNDDASLAFDVYVHRLCMNVAAMAAALGGLDALAFTGGVGEGSAPLRAAACAGLGFLGVQLDEAENTAGAGDRDVAPRDARVRTLVIAAREDLEMARQAREALGAAQV